MIKNTPQKRTHVPQNIKTIKRVMEKLKSDSKYKHLRFEIQESKTSNSIYVKIFTNVNGVTIRQTKRISIND